MRYLLMIFLCVHLCAQSFAATYHVAKTGNDGTGNGSSGNPWLTITKANGSLSAGDTVVIHQGDYAGQIVSPPSGTLGDWTAYVTTGTDTVGLSGTATPIWISNKSYISVNGDFRVRGTGYCIKIYHNYNRIHLENLKVWAPSSGEYNIYADGDTTDLYSDIQNGHYLTLQDCDFYGYWQTTASWKQLDTDILHYRQGDKLLIDSCRFYNVGHYAINTFASRLGVIRNSFFYNHHAGIGLNSGTAKFLVENNVSRTVGMDSVRAGAFLQLEAESCMVRFNILQDDSVTASTGIDAAGSITLYDDYSDVHSRDNRMYHNTLSGRYDLGSPTWADTSFCLWGDQTGTGMDGTQERNKYLNNIFWKGRRDDFLIICQNSAKSGIGDFTHYWNGNLFYWTWAGEPAVYYSGSSGIGTYTVSALQASNPAQWGSSNIWASPVFVDSTASTFILDASSPCVSAAVPLTLANGSGVASTALTVDDGLYISDGYGVVSADSIVIGSTAAVGVSSVSGNVVTLTSQRTWANNDNVFLYRMGNAVNDIGSVQYTIPPEEPPITPTQYKRLRAHR